MSFKDFLTEAIEGTLDLVIKPMKPEHITKPIEKSGFATTYDNIPKDINTMFEPGIHGRAKQGFEYIRISQIGSDAKEIKKNVENEIKKYKSKGYEILYTSMTGKKGQDWNSDIYKYGNMSSATMYKKK